MRKIFLICIVCFCISGESHANWYGNHSVNAPSPGATIIGSSNDRGTRCSSDGDNTGLAHPTYGHSAVANNNSSSTLTPETDAEFNISPGSSIRCLYWDASAPENLSVTYPSGWTNSTVTITIRARDRGGSGIERLQLQQSQNGGSWTTVQNWNNIGAANNTYIERTWNRTAVNGRTFRYRMLAYDDAGNRTILANSNIIRFDTIPPSLSDITPPSPTPNSNLIALSSQTFIFSVSDGGGSPINRIESFFENHATQNSYGGRLVSNSSTHSISPSIQDVDGDGSPTNGVRQYSHKVTRICDEAGNCIGTTGANPPALTTYNYNVFANTTNITQRSIPASQVADVADSNNVADGTTYPLNITLQDQFGNRIIPVASIGRQIEFDIDAYNSVYMNQFTRSGGSAVFLSTPDNATYSSYPLTTSLSTTYSNQPSTSGVYDFDFRVYTPTSQYATTSGADPLARFFINGITLRTSHNPAYTSWNSGDLSVNRSSDIHFNFAPMFQTQFGGELGTTGFIEGVIQSSNISLTKNSTRPTGNATLRKMYLKYNGESAVLDDLQLEFGQSAPPAEIVSEGPTLTSDIPSGSFAPSTYNLATRLSQNLGTTIDNIESTFLSTHLSYSIDGNNVVINSDVIGRNNYYDTENQSSTNQAGVKILGISASDKIQELVEDQFTDDVRIIGKLTKSGFRKDISQKVFSLIRSVPDFSGSNPRVGELGNTWSTSSQNNGQLVLSDTVMVYKNMGGDYVEISGDSIEGSKTIVVIGGDVYITGDITNSNTDSILGIIALKDTAGQGGTIFVDNTVTDLHAILYAEKTLMTAIDDINTDGVIDIDSNEVINASTQSSQLRDQLYIYGSLFSENTIGGSRANPVECPFYTTCSTSAEAQKYDLNYMRRYIQIDTDTPPDGIPDTNANGGRTSQGTSGGDYENFPLVIEYNSAIQSTPPPLFK